MGPDFKLGDLLALELHLYADACAEIVDRAHKELIIEKQISKIEATWAVLSLTFAPYQVSWPPPHPLGLQPAFFGPCTSAGVQAAQDLEILVDFCLVF